MRILSKKSFKFDHPANAEPAVKVGVQDFVDVPDWVKESTMFKLARQDEDVIIVETKQDEVKAEIEVTDNKVSKNKGKTDETTTQP